MKKPYQHRPGIDMIRFHSYGFSLESESVSFRSKSEGFGAEMNCGIRFSVDPVLSGQLGLVDSVRGEYWRRDWDLRDSRGGSMSSVDVRNEFF